MSFEEFRICLKPISLPCIESRYDELRLHRAVEAVCAARSELQYDDIEASRLYPPSSWSEPILVYESSLGLFQIFFGLSDADELNIFMRFAYCNPRSVYEPFCEVASLLMRMFELQCHCSEDFPDEITNAPRDIENPEWLYVILPPSMDYNKILWHHDAGTMEEAALRPDDAVARFIIPICVPLAGT